MTLVVVVDAVLVEVVMYTHTTDCWDGQTWKVEKEKESPSVIVVMVR